MEVIHFIRFWHSFKSGALSAPASTGLWSDNDDDDKVLHSSSSRHSSSTDSRQPELATSETRATSFVIAWKIISDRNRQHSTAPALVSLVKRINNSASILFSSIRAPSLPAASASALSFTLSLSVCTLGIQSQDFGLHPFLPLRSGCSKTTDPTLPGKAT